MCECLYFGVWVWECGCRFEMVGVVSGCSECVVVSVCSECVVVSVCSECVAVHAYGVGVFSGCGVGQKCGSGDHRERSKRKENEYCSEGKSDESGSGSEGVRVGVKDRSEGVGMKEWE